MTTTTATNNKSLTQKYPFLLNAMVREYGSVEAARSEFARVKRNLLNDEVELGYERVIIWSRHQEIRGVILSRGWNEAEMWTKYNNHIILWREF